MLNNPFLGLAGIFIAALATLQTGTAPALNSTQIGAAAAISGGRCEEIYRLCMSNPRQTNKQQCESTWNACVKKKCVVKNSGKIKQCPKDSDCETSCIEYATSKDGLRNCCLIEPSHSPPRCRKLIDDICNPGMPDSYINGAGPTYTEGQTIPPKQPIASANSDVPMVIAPPLTYPQGTTFDGGGMASQLPNQDPRFPMTEIHPYDYAYSDTSNQGLPPEYQPSQPYQTRSAMPYFEALAFNNSVYLSTQGNTPPSELNDTIFNPAVMVPPSEAFDYGFRAEPNKLSVVAPVVHSVPFVPLSTFSQTPISLVTTMGAPIQQPAPAQSF